MVNSNTSFKLSKGSFGKIAEMIYNQDALNANIENIIQQKKAAGAAVITPSQSQIAASHLNIFASSFMPTCLYVYEYITHCVECIGGWGSKAEVRPRWSSDYLSSCYFQVETPEMSCTEAPLPEIIVNPSDVNVAAVNNNRPTNFGTGVLASASAIPSVRHGFSYRYEADGTTLAADQSFTFGGTDYTFRTDATGVNGIGGIRYYYEDQYGNFLAGPDGTDAEPDANGFGQGGEQVSGSNYVIGADNIGHKLIQEASFISDNNEIETYDYHYPLCHNYAANTRYRTGKAYDRLIGQNHPIMKPLFTNVTEQDRTNSGGLRTAEGNVINYGDSGLAARQNFREYSHFAAGLQTPARVLKSETLNIPLLFDFASCKKNAFPWCSTPDADICFTFKLSPLAELFYPHTGSVFIREDIRAHNAADDLEGSISQPILHLSRSIPFLIPGSTVVTPTCDRVNASFIAQHWYTTEIVHLCIIGRILFRTLRKIITKVCKVSCADECCGIDGAGSRFPIEYSYLLDFSLKSKDEKNNPDVWYQWDKLGYQGFLPAHSYHIHKRNEAAPDALTPNYVSERIMTKYNLIPESVPIIEHLEVKLYNIVYHEERPRIFYTCLYPWSDFSHNFSLDFDVTNGTLPMFISYTAVPGSYDIQGVVSVTSQRKIQYDIKCRDQDPYLGIRDGLIVQGSETDNCCKYKKFVLVTVSIVINFLFISDGTARLRYN